MSEDKNRFLRQAQDLDRRRHCRSGRHRRGVLRRDFPPSGKDTVGTIVPAQRFRADQNRPTSGVSGRVVVGNAIRPAAQVVRRRQTSQLRQDGRRRPAPWRTARRQTARRRKTRRQTAVGRPVGNTAASADANRDGPSADGTVANAVTPIGALRPTAGRQRPATRAVGRVGKRPRRQTARRQDGPSANGPSSRIGPRRTAVGRAGQNGP